jgi:ankyrin repeat protein
VAGAWLLGVLPPASENAHAAELAAAAERGDRAAVRALLGAADGESAIDAPSSDGMTALLWAAQANDLELAELLLEAGANPSLGNRYAVTPLWLAATNRSPVLVERLLEHGADAKAAMPHGETALMAAARSGDAASLELLLEAGADPDGADRTGTIGRAHV